MDFYAKYELIPISIEEFKDNVNTKYGIPMKV
jgi:hypothetical protein